MLQLRERGAQIHVQGLHETTMARRNDDQVPYETAQGEMRTGEKLLWVDRPNPAALARKALGKALFGIPFLAFALYWTYTAGGSYWLSGEPAPAGAFPLFGLIFIVAGLGLVASPLLAAIQGRSMVYAISDRRLIILERFPWNRVQSFEPRDIQELERTERGGGAGDIVFRKERSGRSLKQIGFFGIPDVRTVEDKIRKLL
jgi:hypothetical protein